MLALVEHSLADLAPYAPEDPSGEQPTLLFSLLGDGRHVTGTRFPSAEAG
ncbi:hypothetical protein ACH4U5_11810 [Streptomyces sp. NPDC020858]